MPLDPALVGRAYPPTEPYEVGREKIREFADAIGDPNPAYRDTDAAKGLGHPDVIAPPTFPVIVTMRAHAQVVTDPDVGIDYSRVVHGEQRFAAERPLRAGDRLTVTTVIDAVRSVAGNDILTVRSEVDTTDGEHVCTAYSTIVARGTSEEG